MKLPKHNCGLYISHNCHKDSYQKIEDYIQHEWIGDSIINEEEKRKIIETNEIWELQWYPETPIGFYRIVGATLESVLDYATEGEKE